MDFQPVGIFNFANSYRQSAMALRSVDVRSTHPDEPILFLINHAMELYLKAFLHANGRSEEELAKKPFGHRLIALTEEAKLQGLTIEAETEAVLEALHIRDTQIRSRYFKARLNRPLIEDVVDRAVLDLHTNIGHALNQLGHKVRI